MSVASTAPVRRPFLLGCLSALALLEVLNLIVFDDLRTNPNATFVGTFTKPQHLSAIVGTVIDEAH